jgi:hypothetical protein
MSACDKVYFAVNFRFKRDTADKEMGHHLAGQPTEP